MELTTLGREYYPGLHHVMLCDRKTATDGNQGLHTRYRLLLVLQGTGLAEINGRSYPVTAPAAYCLNETSSLSLQSSAELTTKAIYFHPSIINTRFTYPNLDHPDALQGSDQQDLWCLGPFRDDSPSCYGCVPLDAATARYCSALFDHIAAVLESQTDPHWPCRSRSHLLELLFLLARTAQQATASPELPISSLDEILKPVITYLHTHYRDKIKLEHLTRQFHTNKTTLNSRFRAVTGQSVMAYLGNIRMQVAASLLRNTLLPIDDIVPMIGMKDDSHFIRSFRNYAACTPAEYRERHCWMLPQP